MELTSPADVDVRVVLEVSDSFVELGRAAGRKGGREGGKS